MTACLTPIRILDESGHEQLRPCGRCDACLVRSRNEWAFRLRQEWKVSGSAFFITLTYDMDNLPIQEYTDPETGVVLYAPTVVKEEVSHFIRLYRKRFEPKDCRFYAISEYGKERFRPHYHIIMFHKSQQDFIEVEKVVRQIWHSPEITVGPLDNGAVAYCTAYALTRKWIPDYFTPNFRLMSRKPGLGAAYIQQAKDWHLSGTKFYVVDESGVKGNLPRYYRDRIFSDEIREEHCEDTVLKARIEREKFVDEVCGGDHELAFRLRSEAIKDYSRQVRRSLDKKKPTNL